MRIVNVCPLWVLQRRGPAEWIQGGHKKRDWWHLRLAQIQELPPPDMKLFLLLLCCEYPHTSSHPTRRGGRESLVLAISIHKQLSWGG